MDIYLQTHTVTTTDTSPDLVKLAKILPDASVQTMSLCFDWGCRTFSNCIPSPCYTYMRCLSAFSDYGWAYIFTLTPLPPQMLRQICESLLKFYLMQVCKPCHYIMHFAWGCRTFQTASPFHGIHIWEVWAPSQVTDGDIASHSHRYLHRCFPRFLRVSWNPTWCKCANHATRLWLRL